MLSVLTFHASNTSMSTHLNPVKLKRSVVPPVPPFRGVGPPSGGYGADAPRGLCLCVGREAVWAKPYEGGPARARAGFA